MLKKATQISKVKKQHTPFYFKDQSDNSWHHWSWHLQSLLSHFTATRLFVQTADENANDIFNSEVKATLTAITNQMNAQLMKLHWSATPLST